MYLFMKKNFQTQPESVRKNLVGFKECRFGHRLISGGTQRRRTRSDVPSCAQTRLVRMRLGASKRVWARARLAYTNAVAFKYSLHVAGSNCVYT